MKCGVLSIILLVTAACWASDTQKPNQDDVNDSWSIIREDAVGRQLALDDAEKEEIDQLKQDKTSGAEDRSDDNSDEDRLAKEDAQQQDDNIQNESTEVEGSPEDRELDSQSDRRESCGGRLQRSHGRFSSPGFPFGYPNSTRCQWKIRARQRVDIKITFSAFDVGKPNLCRNDYVEIRGAAFLNKRYCGRRKRFSVVVRGTWATVILRSSKRALGRGFSASYMYRRRPVLRPTSHTRPRPSHPSDNLARTLLQVIKATRMQLQAVEKLVILRSKKSRDKYKRGFSDIVRVKVTDAVSKLENRVDIFKHGPSTDAEKSAVGNEMADLKSRARLILNKLDNK